MKNEEILIHEAQYSAYFPHKRLRKKIVGESMTKQSMHDESNINMIMARYEKSGLIEHTANYGAQYANMPNLNDFHEAMNLVTDAQQMFQELPAEMRSEFRNDPGEFLDFVTNPDNMDEMVEMGLANAGVAVKEPPSTSGGDPPPVTQDPPEAAPAASEDPV